MRTWTIALVWVCAFVAGVACDRGGALGAPCLHGGHCASDTCHFGMCVPGTCEGTSGCPEGWQCVDPPPSDGSFLGGLFDVGDSDPIGHCALPCDGCPEGERYTCEENICQFDHHPRLTTNGPYEVPVGQPLKMIGTADVVEGRDIVDARWTILYQESELADGLDGLEVEYTFKEPGRFDLSFTVTDSADQQGSVIEELVVCQMEGGPCEYYDPCCGDGLCIDGVCIAKPVCGNGVLEYQEFCDTTPADGAACTDYAGYDGGMLRCTEDCQGHDTALCDACGLTFDGCTSDEDCCPGMICSPTSNYCREP